MKNYLLFLLAFILTASIGLGIFFGVKYKDNIKDYLSISSSTIVDSSTSSEENSSSSSSSSDSNSSDSSSSSSSSSEEVLDYKALYEEQLGLNNTLINTNSNLEKELDKYEGVTITESFILILSLYNSDNTLLLQTGNIDKSEPYVYSKSSKISGSELIDIEESLKNVELSNIVIDYAEKITTLTFAAQNINKTLTYVENVNINSLSILIDNHGDAGYVNINDNPVIHSEWEEDAYSFSATSNSFSFNEETGMYDLDVRIIFTWNCASI